MVRRRKPITAGELVAELENDPEYVARWREHDRMLAERGARLGVEEQPILSDLRKVGVNCESIWDLVNTAIPYPKAIPVLLEHLRRPYSDVTREGIARSLAVREPQVRQAWPMLVAEYRSAPSGRGIAAPGDTEPSPLHAKDGLACALAVAVTNETLPELIELLRDRSQGTSRVLLLEPLRRRRKNPAVQKVLEELASDPDLEKEIAAWKPRKRKPKG